VVEHRCLVLLALADHDDSVHADGVEERAHAVDGRLVGGDLVAAAAEPRCGQGAAARVVLSPGPTSTDAASAPLSVARTISSARSRSGIVVMSANLSCAAVLR